ncbi:DNA topoisomerase type IIA-like domain superfamily [Arabidopsis thaliana x Arabidopsis arenosa]|uniref:DNA topoisomerase (ATP-hydrolyzing) n=1 Tax=Arabidopsis thaliana x Arabidopsis arenosa TaxID=1240361 RepID=A0A8T2AQU6_9BRAS|nr:DNA topoisomerase type IIA-like domain superfamily [Arabidopsis thaliana x Arabidopsis arenosa]
MAITASMRILIELKDLLEDPPSNFTAVLEELKLEYCELRRRIQRKNVELEILKLKDQMRFVDEVMSGEIIVNNREKADLVQELRQRGYTPNKAKPAGPFDAAEEFDDELLILENKVKFIGGVIRGEIKVVNKKNADLVQELRQRGFTPFPNNAKGVEGAVSGESDYGYLMALAMKTMSQEKVEQFLAEADDESLDMELQKLDFNDAHTAEKESEAAQIKKIKADHISG